MPFPGCFQTQTLPRKLRKLNFRGMKMQFYGRQNELNALNIIQKKKSASLVVMQGRRRVGKSQLIEEFAKDKNYIKLTGVAPTANTTALSQRKAFAEQLQQYFRVKVDAENWWNLLIFLAEQCQKDPIIVLLDEISWMGSKDPEFLGILKTIWDDYFKKNSKLILILCGSVSIWIENASCFRPP